MAESSDGRSIDRIEIMKLLDEVVNGNYVELDASELRTDEERHIVSTLNQLARRQRSVIDSFEENVRNSERRLRDIIESTPLGICITNEHYLFEYVNPTYCRLYGYDASELIGQPFTVVVPDEYKAEMRRLHDEFMGRRYELHGEWKVQRRDGRVLDIIAEAAYIVDVDSRPKKVTFVVDISDRKLAEQRLEQTVEQLHQEIEERKRVESVKQQVERIIRHDLRNPLNGILGAAQLLARYDLPEEHSELVDIILQSGEKLNNMLSTSVDMVRMEEGRYELQPIELSLNDLLAEVLVEVEPLATDKSITLNREFEAEQPLVDGERLYLANLFANLIRNAIEAAPSGSAVTVRVTGADKTDNMVRVIIHNEGAVPDEIRDHFFDRYVTHGKPGGTGIGTYIARLIARVHGGDLSFTSSEQEGTTLYVQLPAATGIIPRASSDTR
ncbi:MAG: two-component system sensor histidine kinase NtrB [Spirochaetia bacterium]